MSVPDISPTTVSSAFAAEESQDTITPETEGIYLARYTVTDEGQNSTSSKVLIIYDTTAPVATGLPAMVSPI